MARQNGVDDLRHHRVVIADDAGKYRAAFPQSGHQVLAQFVFHAARSRRRCSVNGLRRNSPRVRAKLMVGTPQEMMPYADYTAERSCQLSAVSSQFFVGCKFLRLLRLIHAGH